MGGVKIKGNDSFVWLVLFYLGASPGRYSGLIPDSLLSNHSLGCLRDHYVVQGIEPSEAVCKANMYLLYYLSDPEK